MDHSTFILYLLGVKVNTLLFLKVMNMHAGSLVARIFASHAGIPGSGVGVSSPSLHKPHVIPACNPNTRGGR